MTSDDFFASNTRTFDLVFIDGLYEAHQVLKYINNALRFLNPNGTILMHDCNPLSEISSRYPQPQCTCVADDLFRQYCRSYLIYYTLYFI